MNDSAVLSSVQRKEPSVLTRRFLGGLATAIALCWCAPIWADSAEQAFAEGRTLLAKGDLRGALKAYATAAQTDRANEAYVQQFLLVRQVVVLQDSLDKESDAARRTQLGQSLRAFYASQGLFDRALPIDRELH